MYVVSSSYVDCIEDSYAATEHQCAAQKSAQARPQYSMNVLVYYTIPVTNAQVATACMAEQFCLDIVQLYAWTVCQSAGPHTASKLEV